MITSIEIYIGMMVLEGTNRAITQVTFPRRYSEAAWSARLSSNGPTLSHKMRCALSSGECKSRPTALESRATGGKSGKVDDDITIIPR